MKTALFQQCENSFMCYCAFLFAFVFILWLYNTVYHQERDDHVREMQQRSAVGLQPRTLMVSILIPKPREHLHYSPF